MISTSSLSLEYQYFIAVSSLLLLPKILLRFHIPTGISSVALGFIATNFLGWFKEDHLIQVLSIFGITTLFVHAGMEIEIDRLKSQRRPLIKFVAKSVALVLVCALFLAEFMNLSYQISLIISIAIFTPSAGFILNSMKYYDFNEQEIFWIKLKAISKEIAAIVTLVVALSLNDWSNLLIIVPVVLGMFFLLPYLFKFYLLYIAPYAPKTEVSFLVIISFLTGILTKKIGTHYLVGAFATGFTAGQLSHFMTSEHSDRIENSLSSFSNIFIPFYFFSAGLLLKTEYFHVSGFIYALIFVAFFIPLRINSVVTSIKLFLKEYWKDRYKISISLMPNLIFGLIIIDILRERFNLSNDILTGILLYSLVASMLPAIYFKRMPPENYDISKI